MDLLHELAERVYDISDFLDEGGASYKKAILAAVEPLERAIEDAEEAAAEDQRLLDEDNEEEDEGDSNGDE